jgi:hypothetical protein
VALRRWSHAACGRARRGVALTITLIIDQLPSRITREVGSEPRKSSLTRGIMTVLVERLPQHARASLLPRVSYEWEEYGKYTLC